MKENILIAFYNLSNQYLDSYVYLLFIVVIIDIFTGFAKAFLSNNEEKKLDSSVGLKGLMKHVLVIILVLTFHIYCSIFQLISYSQIFISFYIANYGISIMENLGDMGIPVPEFIKTKLNKFK